MTSAFDDSFWIFKWLFVIGLVIAFFFIPEGSNFVFSQGTFYDVLVCVWLCHVTSHNYTVSVAFGLIASIIFIVVQIVILVDFAHSWAENW